MRPSKSWTDAQLIEAVRSSSRLIEVASKLYSTYAGSHYETIKKHIARLGLDCSHFDNSVPKRVKLDQELFVLSGFVGNLNRIRARLKTVCYTCEVCGNNGTWRGSKLVLQMDHRNGDRNDNRFENLRWLCPNCHSQTPTFGSKNRKSTVVPNPAPIRTTATIVCNKCGKDFQIMKDQYNWKKTMGRPSFTVLEGVLMLVQIPLVVPDLMSLQ